MRIAVISGKLTEKEGAQQRLQAGKYDAVIVAPDQEDCCMVYFADPDMGRAATKTSWNPQLNAVRGKQYYAPQPAREVGHYLETWTP